MRRPEASGTAARSRIGRNSGPAVAVAGLVAAAAAATASGAYGVEDLSAMPTPPWWVAVAGSALASTGLAVVRHRPYPGVVALGAGSAGLAITALPRLPHDLLAVMLFVIQRVTGGTAVFEMRVPWLAVGTHLLVITAAALAARIATRTVRAARGACPACGLTTARRGRHGGTGTLRAAAVVSVLAALPYAALKVAWGTGWRGGMTDPEMFTGVTFSTPGFGDTALLTGVAALLATGMAVPLRHPFARWPLIAGGVVGSVMLVPVGLMGTGAMAASLVGWTSVNDAGLAPWVFGLVYPSFLVWGVGLAVATWRYVRVSRPDCSAHLASSEVTEQSSAHQAA